MANDGTRIKGKENTFEWLYFDFDLGDRKRCYIEWHAPIFNLRDDFCMLIIRFYSPFETEKKRQMRVKTFRYPRSLVRQKESECGISFPGGSIYEQNGVYHLSVKEDDLTIALTIEGAVPPCFIKDDLLYLSKENDSYFSWYVPIPRASSSGVIVFDGESIVIEGPAYHDHNWGNLNFGRHFRQWKWLKVLFGDYTFIYGEILLKAGEEKLRVCFILDRQGNKIAVNSLLVDNHGFNDRAGKNRYINDLRVRFNSDKEFQVELSATGDTVVEEVPLGIFSNQRLNNLWTLAYYIGCKKLPSFVKKILGICSYLQSAVTAKLYINGVLVDSGCGNLEVFYFER